MMATCLGKEALASAPKCGTELIYPQITRITQISKLKIGVHLRNPRMTFVSNKNRLFARRADGGNK
jgi:hypothetical protein